MGDTLGVWARLACVITSALLLGVTGPSLASGQVKRDRDEWLRSFLQRWARENDDPGTDTRYTRAWVNLRDDDAQQVIVWIEGQPWCGSGGCTMLVLEPVTADFRVRGYTTITRPPIRVLARETNG